MQILFFVSQAPWQHEAAGLLPPHLPLRKQQMLNGKEVILVKLYEIVNTEGLTGAAFHFHASRSKRYVKGILT